MAVTASQLRQDIYRLLDAVLATGEPLEIERKGRTLRLIAEPPEGSKVERITPVPDLVTGDPEDLVDIDWSAHWNADQSINP